MTHSYRLQLMNPGAEPTTNTIDWALWYAQIRLIGSLRLSHTISPAKPYGTQVADALTWLGEIRRQCGGMEDDNPSAWPDDTLLGLIDQLFMFEPRDPHTFDTLDRGRDPDALVWSLALAHDETKMSLADHDTPGTRHVMYALAVLRFLATYEFPPNHRWAEMPTLHRSMEVWIRG